MPLLLMLARWIPMIFLAGLVVLVLVKLLNGSMPLSGLLTGERRDGSTFFSPGRVQLLVCTLLTAANYLRLAVATFRMASLPQLPYWMIGTLGMSQAVYLIAKARALSVTSSHRVRNRKEA